MSRRKLVPMTLEQRDAVDAAMQFDVNVSEIGRLLDAYDAAPLAEPTELEAIETLLDLADENVSTLDEVNGSALMVLRRLVERERGRTA